MHDHKNKDKQLAEKVKVLLIIGTKGINWKEVLLGIGKKLPYILPFYRG